MRWSVEIKTPDGWHLVSAITADSAHEALDKAITWVGVDPRDVESSRTSACPTRERVIK
jgi:hypothetical protein